MRPSTNRVPMHHRRDAVFIADSRRIDLTSSINGRRYAIWIGLPREATPGPKRALYVLDGHLYFASAVEAARAEPSAEDAVIVGLASADAQNATRARLYDLTLPVSDSVLATESLPGQFAPTSKDVGGLDAFLETLEKDIKQLVRAHVGAELTDQAVFGHSLGGLAVLHALFVKPEAFVSYIASSPSIWWSEQAVLKGEPFLANAVTAGAARPRILITVGAKENEACPAIARRLNVSLPRLEGAIRRARMIDNAVELTARLRALTGASPYRVEECAIFPEQGHSLSAWPALGRAIAFAFAHHEV